MANKLTLKNSADMLTEMFPDVLPDASTLHKRWVWNKDTNSLEAVSTGPSGERPVFTKGTPNKIHPNITGNIKTSQKKGFIRSSEKRTITLHDVKGVAFDLLAENVLCSEVFKEYLRKDVFDRFFTLLLFYFDALFNEIHLNSKPRTMSAGLSEDEKKVHSYILSRKEASQKLLAEQYCLLVTGLSIKHQHHMACGSQRHSNTKKDRAFYETLYSNCCLLVWVAFRRTNLEIIENEVGRLFRSEAFNMHGREQEDEGEQNEKQSIDLEHMFVGHAKKNIKRPSITRVTRQRSPVLEAILPSSKEKLKAVLEQKKSESLHDKPAVDILLPPNELRVGIIGEMISGFNPFTLAPFGDEDQDSNRSSYSELLLPQASGEDLVV